MPFPVLTLHRDGIEAVNLGTVGAFEYALTFVGNAAAEVFRRKASEAGTYGGWRWESSSKHPARHAHMFSGLAILAERIETAIAERIEK